MPKTKLFIDIDGTILRAYRNWRPPRPLQLKQLAGPFLQWAVQRFDCYWLSDWTVNGQMDEVQAKLLPLLPSCASTIPGAVWKQSKTDALPSDGNFRWIENRAVRGDRERLLKRGWEGLLFDVNPYERSIRPTWEWAAQQIGEHAPAGRAAR